MPKTNTMFNGKPSTAYVFEEHVWRLQKQAEAGDNEAACSLACMVLLVSGWRAGDPDPEPLNDSSDTPIKALVKNYLLEKRGVEQ